MSGLPKLYVYPCGCVEKDRRGGPLDRDCGDLDCYRRRRPASTRIVGQAGNRAQRRAAR